MRKVLYPFLFLTFICLLAGCAKKVQPVEFRPLQLHWFVVPGQNEDELPNKDACVIRLTGRLMGEPAVQASPVEELEYRVVYGKSAETAEILEFKGICEDESLQKNPECKWSATCDSQLNIVVKFHNGE
ncbi:hypothetical protein BGX12_10627 [Fibrobacter sp. UWR4]|nr:hypothetical protein BGX12_10627 [Fibrobacter sp. UWR4]PZW70818.1 hypothetical protein C8E88_101010 [Fibrobacter sp. UWR1]